MEEATSEGLGTCFRNVYGMRLRIRTPDRFSIKQNHSSRRPDAPRLGALVFLTHPHLTPLERPSLLGRRRRQPQFEVIGDRIDAGREISDVNIRIGHLLNPSSNRTGDIGRSGIKISKLRFVWSSPRPAYTNYIQ